MKKEFGFTIIEGLLIALVVLVIGFGGYFVWNQQKENKETQENNTTQNTNENSEKTAQEAPPENPEVDRQKVMKDVEIFINKVNIELVNTSDLDRLPDYTPESFVTFMYSVLEQNKSTDEPCSQNVYGVTEISPFNIIGGGYSRTPGNEDDLCGGAPIIWILNPDGTWVEETRNGTLCQTEAGGLVYEEFASECQLGDQWIKNPNGSIYDSNR